MRQLNSSTLTARRVDHQAGVEEAGVGMPSAAMPRTVGMMTRASRGRGSGVTTGAGE
jgi:hypothetical protein